MALIDVGYDQLRIIFQWLNKEYFMKEGIGRESLSEKTNKQERVAIFKASF